MRYQRNFELIVVTVLLILTPIPYALAWDINPTATILEKMDKEFYESIHHFSYNGDRIAEYLINHYKTPVHEWITHMIYGCDIGFEYCSNPPQPHKCAPEAVIAGVRWNDNPPFKLDQTKKGQTDCRGIPIHLPNNTRCWAILYYDAWKDAKKLAERCARAKQKCFVLYTGESGDALLYRVHFGDMQFLHSMASADGEPALETKAKIMAWAEFAYKVARGEIKHGDYLYQCGIRDIEKLFPKPSKIGWNVQYLFTCNDPTYQPNVIGGGNTDAQHFSQLAFGTLLHMIEDSFSRSHVNRRQSVVGEKFEKCQDPLKCFRPGKIVSFNAFVRQSLTKHGMEDKREAYSKQFREDSVTVVDVGKVVKSYYESKKTWDELKEYLECVFSLEDGNAKAGPGNF